MQVDTVEEQALQLVNLSEMDPRWNWLAASARAPQMLHWRHSSTQSVANPPAWTPRPTSWRRAIAAWKAAAWLEQKESILISHGPRMTMYGSLALASTVKRRRHLAYSFNFTELPRGAARKLMALSFKSVERFVCFSNMERQLYARHFDLDIERIDMIHWAAEPPSIDPGAQPAIAGDYICAIGSQARDYATLMQAMRSLPHIALVVVATSRSISGLNIPGNVEVRCSIPLGEAMNILRHSRFNVVPLRNSEVPCGHVTIVAAMHCEKASIVSDSSGVADYVRTGVNGLAVPAGDARALAQAIERLWDDPAESSRLAAAAKIFAQRFCREAAAVDYLEGFLQGPDSSN
jgi:glycosyltransferase involved in cell wall biosynthesis